MRAAADLGQQGTSLATKPIAKLILPVRAAGAGIAR
jgi:hypothetical protein